MNIDKIIIGDVVLIDEKPGKWIGKVVHIFKDDEKMLTYINFQTSEGKYRLMSRDDLEWEGRDILGVSDDFVDFPSEDSRLDVNDESGG